MGTGSSLEGEKCWLVASLQMYLKDSNCKKPLFLITVKKSGNTYHRHPSYSSMRTEEKATAKP